MSEWAAEDCRGYATGARTQGDIYDNLHRLTGFSAGQNDPNGTAKDANAAGALNWTFRQQGWTLSPVGNQTRVKDFGDANWVQDSFNKANEFSDTADSHRVQMGRGKPLRMDVSFSSADGNHFINPAGTGRVTIAGGSLKFTTVSQDTFGASTESEVREFVYTGETIGPVQLRTRVKIPGSGGYAGLVFGYKSPNDYWMLVLERDGNESLYHVEDGARTLASQTARTVDANTWYYLMLNAKRRSVRQAGGYDFTGALPSGKVGLVTSVTDTEFSEFKVADDALWADSGGRWMNNTSTIVVDSTADTLNLGGDPNDDSGLGWDAAANPILLRHIRLSKFRAVFRIDRRGTSDPRAVQFVFHAKDQDHYNVVRIWHSSDANLVPQVYRRQDGLLPAALTAATDPNFVVTRTQEQDLWACITYDWSSLTVRLGDSSANAIAATPCCTVGGPFGEWGMDWTVNVDAGMLGFAGSDASVDDLTLRAWNGSAWADELVETFTADSLGLTYDTLAHDAAGNLTYDGCFRFTFDAFNRMVKVQRAWRDGGGLQTGSTVGTIAYDGLNRRIVKAVGDGDANTGSDSAGDWEMIWNYYHDGQRTIEDRDGGSRVLKQYVWGLTYIDELCQIATNQDPQNADIEDGENYCEWFSYALADTNFNILGVVTADSGRLAEHYEYTPYGRRTVYSHNWMLCDLDDNGEFNSDDYFIIDLEWMTQGEIEGTTKPATRTDFTGDGVLNRSDYDMLDAEWLVERKLPQSDPLVLQPTLESSRGRYSTNTAWLQAGLCDYGHQGLRWDREWGAIDNRARRVIGGRFGQRDPIEYASGANLYQYLGGRPLSLTDPLGLEPKAEAIDVPKTDGVASVTFSTAKDVCGIELVLDGRVVAVLVGGQSATAQPASGPASGPASRPSSRPVLPKGKYTLSFSQNDVKGKEGTLRIQTDLDGWSDIKYKVERKEKMVNRVIAGVVTRGRAIVPIGFNVTDHVAWFEYSYSVPAKGYLRRWISFGTFADTATVKKEFGPVAGGPIVKGVEGWTRWTGANIPEGPGETYYTEQGRYFQAGEFSVSWVLAIRTPGGGSMVMSLNGLSYTIKVP